MPMQLLDTNDLQHTAQQTAIEQALPDTNTVMQPNENGTILLWILMIPNLEHLLGVKHIAVHHQYRQGLVADPSVQLLLPAPVYCTTRKTTGKEQQEVPMKKSEIEHILLDDQPQL
jgi:hypothetical protein